MGNEAVFHENDHEKIHGQRSFFIYSVLRREAGRGTPCAAMNRRTYPAYPSSEATGVHYEVWTN